MTVDEIMSLHDAAATELVHGNYHPLLEKRAAVRAAIESLANDADQAIKLLSVMFDKYDEGVQCYEEPEDCAGFMGNAVELNGDEFSEIVELLDRLAPRDAS